MRVLKFAILATFFGLSGMASADEVTYDLDKVETGNGGLYHDILILGSDRHGLLFRHAKGIAKVDYSQLSMNLRMLYEPVGVPDEAAPERLVKPAKQETGALSAFGNAPYTVTARQRITVPLQGWGSTCFAPCENYRRSWPSHWSRYHPALSLAIPQCRSLAVQDFLITAGLVPRPPGVTTYRLPYNRPYLRY